MMAVPGGPGGGRMGSVAVFVSAGGMGASRLVGADAGARVLSVCSISAADAKRSRGSGASARSATSRSDGGSASVATVPGAFALARQHLDHHRPDREKVGLHSGRLARSPFGGEIAGSAQDDTRERHVVGRAIEVRPEIEALGDAEVGDLRVPILLQEDVAGFDVSVQDPELVGGGEGAERLGHHAEHPRGRERTPGDDLVAQRVPRQAFHDEERGSLLFAEVEDRHDVGVDEAGGEQRLLLEPLPHAGQSLCLGAEDLYGDRPLEPLVEGIEDAGHPALTQQAIHAVATGDQRWGRPRLHPRFCTRGRGSIVVGQALASSGGRAGCAPWDTGEVAEAVRTQVRPSRP